MPVASAHDIARELRNRVSGAGKLKIHKLLYYSQGWHLARFRTPLFDDTIEAWEHGPVVAELWRDEEHGNRTVPAARKLDSDAQQILDLVVERYGGLSGTQLVHRTHGEKPWVDAYRPDESWADGVIDTASLQAFFTTIDEVYSFEPMRLTPERRKIIEEAKTRTP